MSEILLQPEEARGHATEVTRVAGETQDEFEALRTRLLPLADSFRGKSADAFDARIEEWQTSARDLMSALESLGEFLRGAADTIETADQDIASQLG